MLKGKASACMSVFLLPFQIKWFSASMQKSVLSFGEWGMVLLAYLKLKESLPQGQLYHSSFPGKIIMYSVKKTVLSFTALIILYSRLSHFM